MTTADKIIAFNEALNFTGKLPDGIRVMNPYRENPYALQTSSAFFRKYFSNNNTRRIILGINPGRLGAGQTGICFTDTFQLEEHCGLTIEGVSTRELSSTFFFKMINAYGGPEKFYSRYFVSAISPLGFVKENQNGREVNYNYYDSKALQQAVEPFIIETLKQQLEFGIDTEICYCLGTGKNFKYLQELNQAHQFFKTIIPLEHPRYIMQYKLKQQQEYIDKYLQLLGVERG